MRLMRALTRGLGTRSYTAGSEIVRMDREGEWHGCCGSCDGGVDDQNDGEHGGRGNGDDDDEEESW
eukprot:1120166-Rhodomonas_salina.4